MKVDESTKAEKADKAWFWSWMIMGLFFTVAYFLLLGLIAKKQVELKNEWFTSIEYNQGQLNDGITMESNRFALMDAKGGDLLIMNQGEKFTFIHYSFLAHSVKFCDNSGKEHERYVDAVSSQMKKIVRRR